MIANINKLFGVILALSLFTYFERADFNLPLFTFAALLWNQKNPPQKTRVWYLLLFSILVDFIWIVYWAATWNSFNNRELALCNSTLIVSSIIFVIKIVVIAILFIKEPECSDALLNLPRNFKSIFLGPIEEVDYQL